MLDSNRGADNCVRAFLYEWAARSGKYAMPTIADCRLDKVLGHRKSSKYRWSHSDGLTRWLYDHILKHIHIDPYKGLNGDQYRSLCLWLWQNRTDKLARKIGRNVLIGFILRLGFTPSLMEHILFKPQAYVLLFKMFWVTKPLYWIAFKVFQWRMDYELDMVPVSKSTTNKIVLLPTMYELGIMLPDNAYILSVYYRYFKPGSDTYFIGQSVAEKLCS